MLTMPLRRNFAMGFIAEFSPDEADIAGAFEYDALSARDTYDSAFDPE